MCHIMEIEIFQRQFQGIEKIEINGNRAQHNYKDKYPYGRKQGISFIEVLGDMVLYPPGMVPDMLMQRLLPEWWSSSFWC